MMAYLFLYIPFLLIFPHHSPHHFRCRSPFSFVFRLAAGGWLLGVSELYFDANVIVRRYCVHSTPFTPFTCYSVHLPTSPCLASDVALSPNHELCPG
ncbi:hypothetical protein GGR50DRAFT_417043 [Xylaria sp. CBS 124048]|nr:hypothetical protein GGR50DRAFT_417043 [Xylaria sp. CBS 124048]